MMKPSVKPVFKRICLSLVVALAGALLSLSSAHAQSLRAVPAVVPNSAQVEIAGRGLPVGARYLLSLERAGTVENLGFVPVDASGRFELSTPLPPVAAGDWELRVSLTGTVLATAPLRILANPGIEVDPGQGFPGETITVQGFDLTPGASAEIRVDGLRLVGPVLVETENDEFQFDVPASNAGADETIGVELLQRIDDLDGGRALTSMTRLARQQTSFGELRFLGVPTELGYSQTYSLTGSIEAPDGVNLPELDWTYAVAIGGNCLPVPSAVVNMNSNGDFAVINARIDGLIDGIPYRFINGTQPIDDHGLVYRNPETGEQDCITVGGLDLRQEDYVPLKIKVVDTVGNPIGGARVVFRQGFYRSPFEDPGESRGVVRAPGGSGGINTTDAHMIGSNQFTQAEFEAQQAIQGAINGQCPATGILQYTELTGPDVGTATFDLNPFAYWAQYKGGYAASSVDLHTRAPIPDPIEFSIKVAALDLGYGFETEAGCGTGVRFDVQPRNDGFYLRDPDTNEFTIFFDPFGDPLEVVLPELPQNVDLCFPADPYMPGLEQEPVLPGEFQVGNSFAYLSEGFTRFRTVTSFPQAEVSESFFASVSPGGVEIEYDQALFGQLEGLQLTLEGQAPIPMTFSALGGACDIDGGVISGLIPNLHRYPAGSYNATIEGEIGTSGRFVRENVQIIVKEGPTWFVDPTQYENVDIFWTQSKVSIRADEVMQMVDANPGPEAQQELDEYDVTLGGNDQAATAMVEQDIVLGAFQNRIRTSFTDGQVNGRTEPQTPTVSNLSEEDDGTGTARSASRATRSDYSTCAHADGNPPSRPATPWPRQNAIADFGSCTPETLFETGNIPVFRYAWGIPPIAAATLGADFWLGVYFRYFGDVALNRQRISVNFTAEPIIRAGLDVFFDLSALFGVVTARVEATPTIGIGIPISVIDSQFDGVRTCFNFDLIVSYIASLGWCDFCVKAEDSATLFTIAEPSGCSVPLPKGPRGAAPLLANARPAISINEFGTTWIAYETEVGIMVDQRQGPVLINDYLLDSEPGAMRPEMAWLGEDTAIVVWNQTDLDEAAFLGIDGNTDFALGSSRLHLVYSIYDADTDSFGPTQDLTLPGMGGDGGVELAVCPPGQSACGAAGRILAAWEHDRAGDLAMHDLEVRWAEFDGLTHTWGPVQPIAPGNVFKQVQPEVLYHDGEPMVLWVENPDADGTAYDMNQRHLRYRFPNLAAAQDATGVPNSIASPDAVSQDGDVIVVYTISADPTRFIGSRRALHAATGSCTAGLCTWLDEERLDARGRSLYVEQPQLVRGEGGRITAYFRYLANSDIQDDDPVGVKTGTGDIAKLELLAPTFTEPTPLTNDGRINWGLQTVVNPVNGNVMAALSKGPQLEIDVIRSVDSKAVARMRDVRGVAGNPDVFLGMDSSAPDFSIVRAETTADRVAAGQPVEVIVQVMNRGGPASGPTQLVATWDRPFGPALPVVSEPVELQAPGSMVELTLSVPAPENADVDQRRSLYITVDPGAVAGDAQADDSVRRIDIGGLPVPQGLRTYTSRESQLVQIEWNPIEDERVTGYTVYRRNPDGRVLLLGTTETNGFLDLRAVPDRIYEYQVRSHSAKLSESDPTPWMEHFLQDLIPRGLLFRDGFEG